MIIIHEILFLVLPESTLLVLSEFIKLNIFMMELLKDLKLVWLLRDSLNFLDLTSLILLVLL